MIPWKKALISVNLTMRDAVECIDSSSLQIAFVIDDNGILVGTITDGDIRRGMLKGFSVSHPLKAIMNPNPIVAQSTIGRGQLIDLMRLHRINRIPVVDELRRPMGIEMLEELTLQSIRPQSVVIMAGGLGTRLRPLTETCPKALIPVGGRPLLETIISNCIEHGFRHFYISVGYKGEMIKEHFGDGAKWSITIEYLDEESPLGTAGALSLIPRKMEHGILVMNGDLLTKLNLKHLLDFHASHEATATMCVREYHIQVPFGVVDLEDEEILSINEKPIHKFFVNAGIYFLEPDALGEIPAGQFYDMPSLFQSLMKKSKKITAFPIREYWIDVGQLPDLERAKSDFDEVFR